MNTMGNSTSNGVALPTPELSTAGYECRLNVFPLIGCIEEAAGCPFLTNAEVCEQMCNANAMRKRQKNMCMAFAHNRYGECYLPAAIPWPACNKILCVYKGFALLCMSGDAAVGCWWEGAAGGGDHPAI